MNSADEQAKFSNAAVIPERFNWLNKIIASLDKVGVFSRWVNILGIAALFMMVMVTFVNVIARYIFHHPFIGVVEVTEVLMIMAVFLAITHTQNKKAHVAVDLFTTNLTPRKKTVLYFINNLLAIVLFIIIIWRVLVQLLLFIQNNSLHSPFVQIPDAPFAAIIVFGSILMCLLLIRDLLRDAFEACQQGLTLYHWLLMLGIPVLIGILAYFWAQPNLWHISLPLVAVIGVAVTLILMFMGMPIAFTLILTSFIFIAHIRGSFTALDMIGTTTFRTTGNYAWSTLPFFTLMGFVCLYAKFGEDLFTAAFKWFGHLRGGMAMATIGACAAFGAIVGDSIAATATMTTVAIPEMKKIRYSDAISSGCVVGGASLGCIIPPSVTFIIFGLLTGISIGDLFVAGIIPGLILVVCFVITIFIWCRINPEAAPSGQKSVWKTRFVSLKAGGPVLILFLLVIGGIYIGIFTPTEGGAIGAVVALILGLIYKRFNFKIFAGTLLESGQVMSMTFLILIGAIMFNIFLGWCNVIQTLEGAIISAHLSSSVFMAIVILALIIAGMFLNGLSLILISIPVVYPISKALGIDPIWFLMIVGITVNLGNLTPPVGINLFVLKGMRPEVSMKAIYLGSLPFCIATVGAIVILYFVPSLITWLPMALK